MHMSMYNNYLFYIIIFYPDVDECTDETDDCSQTCTNIIGSFICGCNSGYLLDIDSVTCNGK